MMFQTVKVDPFDLLVKACEPVTYSVIRKYYFHGYDTSDLLQEANSVLFDAATKFEFEKGKDFCQFYLPLLKNHFDMLVRKEYTNKRRINSDALSLDQLVEEAGVKVQGRSSTITYPEEVTIAKDTYSKYIIELSPFEQKVFIKFLNGKRKQDIAIDLNTSEDKVARAIYRSTIKLRELVYNT